MLFNQLLNRNGILIHTINVTRLSIVFIVLILVTQTVEFNVCCDVHDCIQLDPVPIQVNADILYIDCVYFSCLCFEIAFIQGVESFIDLVLNFPVVKNFNGPYEDLHL